MNFVFIMDPLDQVIFEKDTSFAFMLGAAKKGHHVFYTPNHGVSSENNTITFNATSVIPQNNPQQPFLIQEKKFLNANDVDAVFVRTDPPFNDQYLTNTWLLDQLPQTTFVLNNPTGIRNINEKIWATQFTQHIPQTIVSCDKTLLMRFLEKIQSGVAKPTDGFGGQSVFKIQRGDSNALVAMETLTQGWQKKIIVQEYVKAAEIGDKRVLLLNGEPLGAVLRVHNNQDHRNNFFAGGDAKPTTITEKEKNIINILRPHLLNQGLYFVGLDFMGELLIEVNVTSPTCLQEMNRLYNKTLEDDVVSFVEQQVKAAS